MNRGSLFVKLSVARASQRRKEDKPKLAGYTEVLAAAHKSVALASLSGGCNAGRIEILLLAACNGNQTVKGQGKYGC